MTWKSDLILYHTLGLFPWCETSNSRAALWGFFFFSLFSNWLLMRKHTEQVHNATWILSLLFPTQVLEDDTLHCILAIRFSLFSAFRGLFQKKTFCLTFYITPNSQVKNEREATSKNIKGYIFKNKTIIQILFL